jgi:GNAT superfamily N-acetyltransferase
LKLFEKQPFISAKINSVKQPNELLSGYEIRLIKEEDILKVGLIYAMAFNNANVDEHWTSITAAKYLGHRYTRQPELFFIALQGEQIVGGFVAEIKPWWDGNHLADGELFVNPNHQGQQLAKKLLTITITQAIEKYGICEVEFLAYGDNNFPLEWYSRIGMKRTGWLHMSGKPKVILEKLK